MRRHPFVEKLFNNLPPADLAIFQALEQEGWALFARNAGKELQWQNSSDGSEMPPCHSTEAAISQARQMGAMFAGEQTAGESASGNEEPGAGETSPTLRTAHEVDLRANLLAHLRAVGIEAETDVETGTAEADVVTAKAIYEFKCSLTIESLIPLIEKLKRVSLVLDNPDRKLVIVTCCAQGLAGLQRYADNQNVEVAEWDKDNSLFSLQPTLGERLLEQIKSCETLPEFQRIIKENDLERDWLDASEDKMRFTLMEQAQLVEAIDDCAARLGMVNANETTPADGAQQDEKEADEAEQAAGPDEPQPPSEGHAEAPAEIPLASEILISRIRIDGGTQTRMKLDDKKVEEYAELMSEGVVFPPVKLVYDGENYWLTDGFHRVAAAKRAGRTTIDCEVKQGTHRDAVLESLRANTEHGLPLTNEEKRSKALKMLGDPEWSQWSDGLIAKHLRVSQPFISKLRRSLSQNGFEMAPTRLVERGGQVMEMETGNIGRRAATQNGSELEAEAPPAAEETAADEATPEAGAPAKTIDQLLAELKQRPNGLPTEELLRRGHSLGQIQEAQNRFLLERHVNGKCYYAWKPADIVAVLREEGTLTRLQLDQMGCQPYTVSAAISEGLIVQLGPGKYALPSAQAETAPASAETPATDAAAAHAATVAAPAERAAPAKSAPAPSIEELLDGQGMKIGLVWIKGLKGKVSVSVNVGDNAEDATRALLDAAEMRPLPEKLIKMIAAQVGVARSRKSPAKKPAAPAKGSGAKKGAAAKKPASTKAAKKPAAPAARAGAKKAAKKSTAKKGAAKSAAKSPARAR